MYYHEKRYVDIFSKTVIQRENLNGWNLKPKNNKVTLRSSNEKFFLTIQHNVYVYLQQYTNVSNSVTIWKMYRIGWTCEHYIFFWNWMYKIYWNIMTNKMINVYRWSALQNLTHLRLPHVYYICLNIYFCIDDIQWLMSRTTMDLFILLTLFQVWASFSLIF